LGTRDKIEAILRLCIYGERNNEKTIAKYFFYMDTFLFKFYLNKKSITVRQKSDSIEDG